MLADLGGGLCLLGLPIVLSASAPGGDPGGELAWSYVIRQSIYMGLGVIAALVVSRTSVRVVRNSVSRCLSWPSASWSWSSCPASVTSRAVRAAGSGSARSSSSPPS